MDSTAGGDMGFRILWLIFLCLAYPSVAPASLKGTAHDFEFGQVEPDPAGCASLCHGYIDAGSDLGEVERAWLVALVRGNTVGTVSAMCGSCHLSGGGYSAVMQAAFSDNNVYGAKSHGTRMSLLNPPPGTDPGGSALPRIGAESGIFQCSTCHNPHDDTLRPFLKADIGVLCVRCHVLRGYLNGTEQKGPGARAGTWQIATYGGTANPGSHPMGEDVVPGRAGGPEVAIPATFRVRFPSTPGQWSLGGHLSGGDTGGVVCVSCHAVHGTAPDPDDPLTSGVPAAPSPSFLVIPQAVVSIAGSPTPVPNGNGESNALCEACHGVGNNPPVAAGGATWADAAHNVAPGKKGAFPHPVDSYPSNYDTGVTVFPEGWPSGAATIAGDRVSPVPICESCHVPHPAAVRSGGRLDVKPGAGPYILRAATTKTTMPETLCDLCHGTPFKGHHPVGKTFHSGGVPYLQSVSRAAGDRLTCGTCHTTAHDWKRPGEAGLDPFWLPSNNGRGATQALDMYNKDMSKTCMDCHYAMDGDAASVNPSMGSAQTVIDASDKEYAHYQKVDRGNGTHYIGLINEGPTAAWVLAPILDIFDATRTWKAQKTEFREGLSDGWARFGGIDQKGYRVLVCESCHELEPDRNGGFRHLLLAPYEEGRNGIDEFPGDRDGRDILCESCHGVPKGTHPMSGMVVSRTEKTLDPKSEWVRQTILGTATLDPVGSFMSCDSCHQPHDANTDSYSWCIDAPVSIQYPGRGIFKPINAPVLMNPNPAATLDYPSPRYATPTTKSVEWTGFCEQCHMYW